MTDHAETTAPCLTFTATIPGEVPALCRLVVDEDQGKDQLTAIVAARVRNYDADPPAAMYFEVDTLTPLGAGAAVVTSSLPTGNSGSGCIYANALTTSWQDVFKSTVVGSALTSVTGANSGDVFTKTSHGMVNGASVLLSAKTGGSGLSTSTTYYVINRAANTFQLSLTPGGAAVDLGSDVSSMTVTPTTYWTHTGAYRAMLRVEPKATNTGDVEVRASWGLGDLAIYSTGRTRSAQVGTWTLVDLGVINVPSTATRWEFRAQARSTVDGDAVYMDVIYLPCADEVSGTAQVLSATPKTTQTINDAFTRSGDRLNATTPAPQTDSNNWAESTATSFTLNGTQAQRVGESDTAGLSNGKYATVGAVMAGQFAQVETTLSATPGLTLTHGLLLRYVDSSNWAIAVMAGGDNGGQMLPRIYKRVAGTTSFLANAGYMTVVNPGDVVTHLAAIYPNGRFDYTPYVAGASAGFLSTIDADLAAGGALDDGKVGIFDHYTTTTDCVRTYDNFIAGTILSNAACFASQSIEFGPTGVRREDAAGVVWGDPGNVQGDHLLIPPGTAEVFVKLSRGLIGYGGDVGVDDLSAKLYVTERGLLLPS